MGIVKAKPLSNLQNAPSYMFDSANQIVTVRSSCPEVFLRKGVLKICSTFIGEQPYRSVISIKLQSNIIEITLRHECSPVNLLHIFRTPFQFVIFNP